MTSAEVIVTLMGVSAIVWINWYFFVGAAGRTSQSKHDDQHH
jgi:hypothetical protein